MVDYVKLLGQNVRRVRVAAGLSQEALALELGIDRTYISGIERGVRNPSIKIIVALAERLGSSPAELLSVLPGSAGGDALKRAG